jgi:hypothetical protein
MDLRNCNSLQYFLCIIFTDITGDVATVFNEMAGNPHSAGLPVNLPFLCDLLMALPAANHPDRF